MERPGHAEVFGQVKGRLKWEPGSPTGGEVPPAGSAGFRGWGLLWALAVIAAGTAAYWNSFSGQFVFDDREAIVENPLIRRLWPIGEVLFGQAGQTLAGRPVVALTVAVNYALGGLEVWGYHAFNLAVHLLGALVLMAIIRRALLSAGWGLRPAHVVALVAAAIWTVHPLQTAAVTYVIQRAETIMALFYLLTLYCAIRSFGSGGGAYWGLAAVASCALGMGSKEAMATAPLMVLVYDRVLVSGSFVRALRRRWALYAGLAGTWAVLAALMWPGPRARSAGFGMGEVRPWEYAATQFGVIAHYLRLAFWPEGLCLDYGWPVAKTAWRIIPPAILILALAGLSAWALVAPRRAGRQRGSTGVFTPDRRRMWGLVGAWFFVILAPTSSVVPIVDAAFEHRMYLPLAAVIVAVVTGACVLGDSLSSRLPSPAASRRTLARLGLVMAACVVAILGWRTARRNVDYQSVVGMWQDVVAKRPSNDRARCNLGFALRAVGRTAEAIAEYQEALRWKPDCVEAHYNVANALLYLGRPEEAIPHYEATIRLMTSPAKLAEAYNNLGVALAKTGKPDRAILCYQQALKLNPDFAAARKNLESSQRSTTVPGD